MLPSLLKLTNVQSPAPQTPTTGGSVFAVPQRASSAGRLNFNSPKGKDSPDAPSSPTKRPAIDKENTEFLEKALNKVNKNQVEKYPDVLGIGGFATVYRGKYRGCDVAIKSFMAKVGDEEFKKEVQKLSGLRHPNIVQYMGYCPSERWIIMEWMQKGSLFNYIHDVRRPELTWLTKVRMAADVASAMTYLHRSRVRHCDLNSKNLLVRVFSAARLAVTSSLPGMHRMASKMHFTYASLLGLQLDRDCRIKVADLGLSEEVAEDAFSQTDKRVGTLRWIAPEMLAKNCKSMEKADVYSYGIVLFELGYASPPFWVICSPASLRFQTHSHSQWSYSSTESIPYHDKLDADLKRVIQKGIPPTSVNTACWRDCPRFKEIMNQCLQFEPDKRPSFSVW
jgi:serine/threonine protein kinase